MTGKPKSDPPKRPPEMESGDAAFDRLRDLTRRVVAVPRRAVPVKPAAVPRTGK